ncbi:MAG TPA: transcription antitermination factor NusB, partial [Terriglobales bacterium]|nr:transcription antitermination factor NusB [Terriglobales bacterium]
MPISAARAAAFDILMRIETTDAYSSELLHSARFAKLSPADHGLLTELVMGVLRWRGALDDRITGHRRPLPGRTGPPAISVNQPSAGRAPGRLDLEVLTALRLGAYQLLFLDRVPRHAAVSESVELVKRARKSSAAGLVNAVLRKVHRGDFRPDCRSAHPHWLVERWEQTYGADVASRICMRNQSVPETVVHICRSHRQPDVGTAAPAYPRTAGPAHKRRAALDGEPAAGVPARNWLAAEGIRLEPGKLLAHAAIVTAGDIFRASA